ncbi:hypothetical protein JCM16303_005621 [Sporobolomyces ruberrimus]
MVRTRSQLVQASHQAQPAQNNAPPSFNSEHATSALSTSSAPHRIPELCPRSTEGSSPRTEGQPTISEGPEEESEDFLDDGKEMLKWGYILLVGSTTCFAVGIWSIAIGPYVDASGLDIFEMLARDTYYKYLVFLLIPVTTCCVIINWWGLKIFRHA